MADANEDEELVLAPDEAVNDQVDPPEAEEAEDEVLVSFEGEEGAPAQGEERDSSVIRQLREENRKKDAEIRGLKASHQPVPEVIEVGEKPTLDGCEYDPDKFETALDAWKDRKAKAEQAKADAQKIQDAQQQAWNKRLADMETQKASLPVKDYDQALAEVRSTFNEMQQAMLVRATKNPARMVYALGKSPQKLAELAKIQDPVELIAELARLEGKVTVSTQRKAPPPEQIIRGSAPLSAQTDKQLERLEAEAARTGDRTKIVQYKRAQKAKGRS